MTGHRAASPLTAEVIDLFDGDLCAASRPESMRPASVWLPRTPSLGESPFLGESLLPGEPPLPGEPRLPRESPWDRPPPARTPPVRTLPAETTKLYAADQPTATRELSPRPESVKAGRDFACATLRDWGLGSVTDVAELVVSELLTNALRHGVPSGPSVGDGRGVRLRLLAQPPFVMCMVSDPGADIPVLRDPCPDSESGRGLRVVEACSVRWGWHLLDGGGKVVWALLR